MNWKLKTRNGQVGKPENKPLLKKRKRRRRRGRKRLIVKTNVVELEALRRTGPSVLSLPVLWPTRGAKHHLRCNSPLKRVQDK